jgi:hypothetical protein
MPFFSFYDNLFIYPLISIYIVNASADKAILCFKLFKNPIYWEDTFISLDIHVLLLTALFIVDFSGNTLLK